MPPGPSVKAGTVITLTAGDDSRYFEGWSLGERLGRGGAYLSGERSFSFTLTPEVLTNGILSVYANYIDATTLTYHANGGEINRGSYNLSPNEHYEYSVRGETLEVTYGDNYLAYLECASSFFDDGSFTRAGYVLREYNTAPDGSGVAYSLGSKIPRTDERGLPTVVYCIWSEATPSTDFLYEDINISRPAGVTSARAPHWAEDGIVITKYLGDADTVTVPEYIGGKAVTAIAAGAFTAKSLTTLHLSSKLLRVEDGAFVGCTRLATVYYPDGLYYMSDAAFDDESYTSFQNFYVNATLAPRFDSSDVGALAVKLSRLLAPTSDRRVIVISGSSSLQGLGSEYLEALLGQGYRVVNLGTTRTTHGAVYLEAMAALAREGDIIVYAPENSSYMFGERELYYKTFRDLEGMVNIYRYVDFSSYRGMFSSMTDLNQNYRYTRDPVRYEDISVHGELLSDSPTYASATTNKYGDFQRLERVGLVSNYHDTYFLTMNGRVKSRFEGGIYDDSQIVNKDYRDPNNVTWASINDEYFTQIMNKAIAAAKSSGASVYFGFCPVDEHSLVEGAEGLDWLLAYDALIEETYLFDGLVGSAKDYIFDHSYFYDCAFHPNDYGRTLRTYQLYLDLAELLGIPEIKAMREEGTDFEGCLFESGEVNGPALPWSPEE